MVNIPHLRCVGGLSTLEMFSLITILRNPLARTGHFQVAAREGARSAITTRIVVAYLHATAIHFAPIFLLTLGERRGSFGEGKCDTEEPYRSEGGSQPSPSGLICRNSRRVIATAAMQTRYQRKLRFGSWLREACHQERHPEF